MDQDLIKLYKGKPRKLKKYWKGCAVMVQEIRDCLNEPLTQEELEEYAIDN